MAVAAIGCAAIGGVSHAHYDLADGRMSCPHPAGKTAFLALPEDSRSPEYTCVVHSQQRVLVSFLPAAAFIVLQTASGVAGRRRATDPSNQKPRRNRTDRGSPPSSPESAGLVRRDC